MSQEKKFQTLMLSYIVTKHHLVAVSKYKKSLFVPIQSFKPSPLFANKDLNLKLSWNFNKFCTRVSTAWTELERLVWVNHSTLVWSISYEEKHFKASLQRELV
jgi:hypothetical protein